MPVGQTDAVDGYESSTYGERFADVYDDWYPDVTDAEGCVATILALVERAGGGPVLELGVGTGRLAVPLARSGLEVHGVDASQAMLERLRARPGGEAVRTVLGDMAEVELPDLEPCAVVLIAFNTLFNLGTEDAQARCLQRAARALAPSGRLLVETFVPRDDEDGSGAVTAVEPRRIELDQVVLTVSRSDPADQTVTGQHVQLTERGVRLRPWHLRWLRPDQLDELAGRAGLALDWRAAGWRDEPFDDSSAAQVSCYRAR